MGTAPKTTEFAKLTEDLIARCGGLDEFTETAQVSARSAQLWATGAVVPPIRRLAQLAELFELDIAEVLTAAGRPPSAAVRARLIVDGANSLALRLAAWLDEHDLTNKTAARRMGIDHYTIARLANGARLTAPKVTYRVAAALELDPVELARTDGTDELVATMVAHTGGLAGVLRARLDELDIDHYDPTHVERTAGVLGATHSRFRGFLTGSATPNLTEAVKLAQVLNLELSWILAVTGIDERLARRWADAATSTPKRGPREELGEILRAYRLVREMSVADVAAAVGYETNSAVVRNELHERTPSPEMLTRYADVLDIPLGRLFAAAGYHCRDVAV